MSKYDNKKRSTSRKKLSKSSDRSKKPYSKDIYQEDTEVSYKSDSRNSYGKQTSRYPSNKRGSSKLYPRSSNRPQSQQGSYSDRTFQEDTRQNYRSNSCDSCGQQLPNYSSRTYFQQKPYSDRTPQKDTRANYRSDSRGSYNKETPIYSSDKRDSSRRHSYFSGKPYSQKESYSGHIPQEDIRGSYKSDSRNSYDGKKSSYSPRKRNSPRQRSSFSDTPHSQKESYLDRIPQEDTRGGYKPDSRNAHSKRSLKYSSNKKKTFSKRPQE
jgi:hypothetical protein